MHVLEEVRLLAEGLGAGVALERFLAGVRAQVHLDDDDDDDDNNNNNKSWFSNLKRPRNDTRPRQGQNGTDGFVMTKKVP